MKTVKYRDYQAALTALKNQFEEDGINIYDMVRTPEDPGGPHPARRELGRLRDGPAEGRREVR